MKEGKSILHNEQFELTMMRLAHQVVENYPDWDKACIIGIQESGVKLSEALARHIRKIIRKNNIAMGKLDITFYRDDFRTRSTPIQASTTELDFDLEGRRVILVDDVLYTGRTVQAAMSAMQDFGRPAQVELLILVDRRFLRHLPIQADYTGITIDALDEAYVSVEWSEELNKNQILLYSRSRNEAN